MTRIEALNHTMTVYELAIQFIKHGHPFNSAKKMALREMEMSFRNDCPLCEYTGAVCENCPINWGTKKNQPCLNNNSPYAKLLQAQRGKLALRYCERILRMCRDAVAQRFSPQEISKIKLLQKFLKESHKKYQDYDYFQCIHIKDNKMFATDGRIAFYFPVETCEEMFIPVDSKDLCNVQLWDKQFVTKRALMEKRCGEEEALRECPYVIFTENDTVTISVTNKPAKDYRLNLYYLNWIGKIVGNATFYEYETTIRNDNVILAKARW